MKPLRIIWMVLLVCWFDVPAQNKIDSLISLLTKNQNDSATISTKLEISQAYYNTDLKQSLAYAQQALELAQDKNYQEGIQHALSVLSRIHRRLGNFTIAIEYNLRQVAISEKRNDAEGVIDAYTTLGNISSSVENYKESKNYLFLAYDAGKKNDAANLSSIMNFIGRNYGKMGVYDSAEIWILNALEHETKYPQEGYTLSYIYNNLAEVYIYQKKYDRAIRCYLLSKELPAEEKSHFGETFTLNGLAKAYQALEHYDQAINALKESITISTQYGYRDKTKESYGILYEIYEERKDYKNALRYYKEFNLYQDSIFSEDKLQFIENLKINYETEQIASENEILKKDAQLKDASIIQQKTYTLIGVILIISISGAFVFLFYTYKQNKKRNKFLADYNTNLETQVTERTKELVNSNLELIKQNNQLEQFGYITAHNLRAPVARILGLINIININAYDPAEDKYILEKLQITTKELDTIIHDMNAILDIKKGVENSYEIVDFHERIRKIRNILKDNIANTEAIIEEDFSTVKSCFAVPAYIESILYNLISNAIKYRSLKRIPKIKISTGLKNNHLELTVSDNGIGIDLKNLRDKVFSLYQRFHIHIEGKGIGLFLVKTQVEAMNGTIEIESNVNAGTTFRILIPLKMIQ